MATTKEQAPRMKLDRFGRQRFDRIADKVAAEAAAGQEESDLGFLMRCFRASSSRANELEAALSAAGRETSSEDRSTAEREVKCCERDHNNDGNCDIHAAPGILRCSEMLRDGKKLDALTLLRQIAAPCDVTIDHKWRDCKRCMAVHGVEMRFPLSMRLLQVAIDAVEKASKFNG